MYLKTENSYVLVPKIWTVYSNVPESRTGIFKSYQRVLMSRFSYFIFQFHKIQSTYSSIDCFLNGIDSYEIAGCSIFGYLSTLRSNILENERMTGRFIHGKSIYCSTILLFLLVYASHGKTRVSLLSRHEARKHSNNINVGKNTRVAIRILRYYWYYPGR